MATPTRVQWNTHAADNVQPAVTDGLLKWAGLVKTRSQDEVPVLTGELRSTATVSVEPAQMTAAISYDGVEAPIQHERMDYHHDNGNAKFLEGPLNATRREGLAALAAAVRHRIGN